MYHLDVIMIVITKVTSQGTDGAWCKESKVDFQRVYVPIQSACQ